MAGMTFNGVSSASLYLDYAVPVVPLLPRRTTSVQYMSGRDGLVDFGNDAYESRIIPVTCLLCASSEAQLAARMNDVAAWLSGSGKLLFDHDVTKRWDAKVYDIIPIERYPGIARFTVEFSCGPYAEDASLRTGTVGSAQNYGSDVPFYPVITVTLSASASYVQVTLGGKFVRVQKSMSSGDVIAINMSTGKVTVNGSNVMAYVRADSQFFAVPTGTQTITVTATGGFTASMSYRRRYLYA